MNNEVDPGIDALRQGRVYVAGHGGMVGSAIMRKLDSLECGGVLTASRAELDLENQSQVRDFFATTRPEFVFLAAAKVGGINANNQLPAEFIYDNLMIAANIIDAAHKTRVNRLLFLGSSCIYPKHADQPISEEYLLDGKLEGTNEPYAIAKIAGIKLCESYNRQYGMDLRSVMPTNLYGPNDNFGLQTSHVLPALIRKFHEAKISGSESVEIWGSGKPKREFLHVDDLAEACVHIIALERSAYESATQPMLSHLNVGTGKDISIRELAELVGQVTGFSGQMKFNTDYPDGTPRKLLNIEKIRSLGWKPRIGLRAGVEQVYSWYLDNHFRDD